MSRFRKSHIIAAVGQENYLAASQYLQGHHTAACNARSVVNHVKDSLLSRRIPSRRRLVLLFQCFEDLPSYGLLWESLRSFSDFNPEDKALTLQWMRQVLEHGTEKHKSALGYLLWADFFENPQLVEEIWYALTYPLPNTAALHIIFIHSGPVPWEWKWTLYHAVKQDVSMHYAIFRSILHSQYDIYGQINQLEAWHMLQELTLPANTENKEKLWNKLQKDLGYNEKSMESSSSH